MIFKNPWLWGIFCATEPSFSCEVLVVINLCLPPGCPVTRHSCDQLEQPDVSMDSYAERLTAVQIHKQGDWLRLGFISCVIDCCWHDSCQWRKWLLTNDRVVLAAREITFSSLQSHPAITPHPRVFLSAFLLPHSITAKQIIQPKLKHICSTHRIASMVHIHMTFRWVWTSVGYST